MAVAPKKLTSWSFSRLKDYEKCPLACKRKHIDKIKEPPSEAMERGIRIGGLAEQYIKGTIARLPAELKSFEADFKVMRKQYAAATKNKGLPMVVEDQWAFTKEWSVTQWNDWVACWVRIKLDVGNFLEEDLYEVTDWKTGKFRPEQNAEYMDQVELYVLAALLIHYDRPTLRVRARLCYLDTGDQYPLPENQKIYTQADVKTLKAKWEKRVKKMLADTVFRPTPGNHCRWCQHSKSKGGTCKF